MRLCQNLLGGGHLLGTSSWGRLAIRVSGVALSLLTFAMLCPSPIDSASAEETTSKLSLAISPTLSLSLQDTVNLNVTPTQNGTFSSNTATLAISTNNETGYSLYMATSNGKNTLASQNPNTTDTISAISSDENGIPSTDFPSNTWGYSLDEAVPTNTTTYQAVPTDNTTALTTTSTASNDSYNLTFGAKVDTSLPSGTYSNQVIISAVANPAYVPSISEMTNMQDITAEICAASANGETATLTDTRDNNTYTIAKINGACWMTQSLRLSGGRTLTPADSNVTSNWSFPTNSLTSGNSYTEARSTISSDTSYGGYYNFCAASAGTVCAQTQQDATQDICPKGWRLPTRDEMNGITSYTSAFSPVYSGYYYNGSLYDTGSRGTWWLATALSGSSQYYLYYNSGSLDTGLGDKHNGLSVRCIRTNPGTVTINFNGNGATGGTTASQQIAAGDTAPLNINGFTRTDYSFTGWNTAANGSGISYADGADYAVTPATGDTTITLYAQWKPQTPTMQDFTVADCQAQASSDNITVVDLRDNNTYAVRYINGACWMTQNLRLSSGRTLTPEDSNVTSNWTFPTGSLTSGNSYTEARSTISSNTSYGGYYNYCAASAGTVCSETKADAEQDICPKGWRLPTDNEINSITDYVSAFSPVYSGSYYDGSPDNSGSSGYWWSATANGSNLQNFLYYESGTLSVRGDYKSVGQSIRCVRSS